MEIKENWTKFIACHPFEWWITLSFRCPVKRKHAKIMLTAWTRKLIKGERLQIAYFAVINEVNRIHLHLLALGRNRRGKTLLDVPIDKWNKKWNAESKIRPIYDIEGVSRYLSGNLIIRNEDLSDVYIYNIKLLKKLRYKDVTGWNLNEINSDPNIDKNQVRSQMTELINSFKDKEVSS